MTDEELRIKIAESEGFFGIYRDYGTMFVFKKINDNNKTLVRVPAYTTSLDAIMPLVRGLEEGEIWEYQRILCQVTDADYKKAPKQTLITATARQHAEAYAKTKGIWK